MWLFCVLTVCTKCCFSQTHCELLGFKVNKYTIFIGMEKQKKIIIASLIVVFLLGLTFLNYNKVGYWFKNTSFFSQEEPFKKELLSELKTYADSIGIDTSRYTLADNLDATELQADTLIRRLVLEIKYGKKVTGLLQNKIPEQVDSATIFTAPLGKNLVDSLKKGNAFTPYAQLVAHYDRLRGSASDDTLRQIRKTLNFYRWLNRFELDRFIVVNIPAAELNVYDDQGKRLMPMQVIAGSKKNATPLFTTYLTDIIAYPYWNVPQGIAVKELLPKIQQNPGFLDSQNLEILDKREKVVDPESIDWESLSATNFPYRIRQTSGCHNSLGLIKFNLDGPGAIYMHDTNARNLFEMSTDRWRSHGCMRLEKPVEFANYLLGETKFDEGFYNRCLIDQKPSSFKLPKKYPVFVIYNLVDVNAEGRLVFYRDVYGQLV